jgi:hypothetical protein
VHVDSTDIGECLTRAGTSQTECTGLRVRYYEQPQPPAQPNRAIERAMIESYLPFG